MLSLGYVLFPEDENEGHSTVLRTIEFKDHGKSYANNLTIWGGGKVFGTRPREDNTTVFEFRGVSGENQTVLDVLLRAGEWGNFTIEYTEHATQKGSFVDSIADVENGDESWRYYVNDEYGIIASDRKQVRDNDIIRWSYE